MFPSVLGGAGRDYLVAQCLAFLPRFDLAKFGQRLRKYIIEKPHRVQNFAHGCGCFGSISLAEGKHAVIAQVSHDTRFGNPVIEQVT